MPLAPGTRIGSYEISSLIGVGGMGEVYRATDTSLKRAVAVKVLPEAVAADADRLARFQREAEVLASLNHAGIAHIYGIEEAAGVKALVMELVEGPTLADRIAQGRVPLGEALPIAKQIAEALEAAHEHGVVHRDLKPANVKIRPDGTVKLLDFGLAKAMESTTAMPSGMTQSPTLTTPAMTQAGIILGTAAYMAPEQAKGAAVTRTADVWAFGVVLLEMLTGQQPFTAPTISETLARVLERQASLDAVPPDTPASVRRLLRRCLVKDPRQRLQHLGDARLELDEAPEPEAPAPESRSRSSLPWQIAAAIATIVAAGALLTRGPGATAPGEVTRFTIQSANGEHIATHVPLALSPDGRRLVYAAGDQASDLLSSHLIVHDMDTGTDAPIASVTGAGYPFFSPDGSAVAFSVSGGGISRVSLSGGAPTSLVSSSSLFVGGSWRDDGTIVSAVDWGQPLLITEAGRSTTRPLTTLDVEAGEGGHLYPQVLPDGRTVLFTIWTGSESWDESRLAVADIQTGEHHVVLDRGVHGRYTPTGHLVFWRGNALMAAPFDLDSLSVRGDEVTVVEGVRLQGSDGSAHFAVSDSGTLAYVPGGLDFFRESLITDRTGREIARLDRTAPVGSPEFSPDGRQVAVTIYYGGAFHVGVYDLERDVLATIASTGDNLLPAWTTDGSAITYLSNAEGRYSHYTVAADGSGQPRALLPEPHGSCCNNPAAWSPVGESVVFSKRAAAEGDMDLWVVSSPGSAAEPLVTGARDQTNAAFDPAGRFIVYESAESGANEIWMRPFPDASRNRQRVSQGLGTNPVWSRDGREILYVSRDGIMRVPVLDASGSMPRLGRAELALAMTGISAFDLSPDGERFVISRFPDQSASREIRVVLNWFEELRRLVPTR